MDLINRPLSIINSTCVLFKKMQTLIHPQVKLRIASFDNSNCQIQEKLNNSKFDLDNKFYQKLFIIILATCSFLIFPESPQDSEALCRKYQSTEACKVW